LQISSDLKLFFFMMGLSRFELLTIHLSGVYSNHLSYRPINKLKPRGLDRRIPLGVYDE